MKTRRLYPNHTPAGLAPAELPLWVALPEKLPAFRAAKLVEYLQLHYKGEIAAKAHTEPPPDAWSRAICIGSAATTAIVGRKIPLPSCRTGVAWHYQRGIDAYGPVFWVFDPTWAKKNRFYSRALLKDLSHALSAPVSPPAYDAVFHVVETEKDAEEAAYALRGASWSAYDCETAGLMFSGCFDVVMLAATTNRGHTYVWDKRALNTPEVKAPLIRWLEDPDAKKVGHNLKFDMLAPLSAWGTKVRGFHSDTRLKRKLGQADAIADLETCSELVGLGGYKQEFAEALALARGSIRKERMRRTKQIGQLGFDFAEHPALVWAVDNPKLKADTFAYALVPEDTLAIYCARDAYTTAQLEHYCDEKLQQHTDSGYIWGAVAKDATPALVKVQAAGVLVDQTAMVEFETQVVGMLSELRDKLGAAGLEDPNSHQKTAAFLFGTLGLTPLRKSEKTGAPSTDVNTLKTLAESNPEAGLLLEYRRLEKLRSAYGESLRAHIMPTGRVHPELKLDGTRTGRLSCRNPGLHQIPRKESREGKLIKDCFVAPEGYTLIQCDYSQLELRVAGMLARDEVMKDLFLSGIDFHLATAMLIGQTMWEIQGEKVKALHEKGVKKYRTAAKTFNFGLLYGMTERGMAQRMLCTVEEATKLKAAILGEWKGLAKWIETQEEIAKETGYTHTEWAGHRARRRQIWGIGDINKHDRLKARNAAINTPVQGTASDFCLASISRIVSELENKNLPARVILSVHDSIIVECRDDCVPTVAKLMRDIMQSWDSGGFPIKVDCEAGKRWGSLVALDV